MLKNILKTAFIIALLPILGLSQTKTATEGYVDRSVSNEASLRIAGDVASTNYVNGATNDLWTATTNWVQSNNNVFTGTNTFNNDMSVNGNLVAKYPDGVFWGFDKITQTKNLTGIASNWLSPITNTVSLRQGMSKDGKYQAYGTGSSSVSNFFYFSSDYGVTFTPRLTNSNWSVGTPNFSANGQHVWFSFAGGHLTSTDWGNTWVKLGDTNRYCGIARCSADGRIRLAPWTTNGITGGGYANISYDYGVTWTALTNLPTFGNALSSSMDEMSSDGKYISFCIAPNIYQSRDYGRTWVTNNAGFTASGRFTHVSSDGKYQAHPDWNNAIFISTNYGVTWSTNNNAPKGSGARWASIVVSSDGSKMVAGMDNNTNIWYSLDYGTTWTSNAITGKIGTSGIGSVSMSADGKFTFIRDNSRPALYRSIAEETMLGNLNVVQGRVASSGGFQTTNSPTSDDWVVNYQTMTNKVQSYGYVTSSITNDLATTNFVTSQGYVTSNITNDLASTNWVTGLGYVTSSITNDLASTNFVTTRGYVTESITNDLASTNWVSTQGFVTDVITNGLASTNFVTSQGYVTSAITNGVVSTNWLYSGAVGSTNAVLSDGTLFDISSLIGGVTAHNNLTGRDVDNTHPMGAITDLTNTLTAIAVNGTNYTDSVAEGLTNYVNGVALAGSNYTDSVSSGVAQSSTNYANSLSQSSSNYTFVAITNEASLRVSGDLASTNYANSISQSSSNYTYTVITNEASLRASGDSAGSNYVVTGFVPYIGATTAVNIGTNNLTAGDVYISTNGTSITQWPSPDIIYQPTTITATSTGITNTITVLPAVPIYKLTVTNLTSVIAFDISNLNLTDNVATWETFITVATTNVSLAYPSTNLVYYVTTPTLSTTTSNKTLYAVWRAFITGTTTNIFCNQWLSK